MGNGFSQFLSNKTKEAAAAEANRGEVLQMIDIDLLVPNPNNKYRICEVDSLASMIAANSFHVEALEVMGTKENGKYMIVAGHRRCAAWRKLLDEGATEERRLPCRIASFKDSSLTYQDDNGETKEEVVSADQQATVRLILSNLGQRKCKTLEEEVWEIEQLTPYARALYNETQANSETSIGTFKSFFAREILQISPSALQRKRSLSRLTEEARKALYDEGIINESSAIELSSFPPKDQDRIVRGIRSGELDSSVMSIRRMKKNPTPGDEDSQGDGWTEEESASVDQENDDQENDADDEEGYDEPQAVQADDDGHADAADAWDNEKEEEDVGEDDKPEIPKSEPLPPKSEIGSIPVPQDFGDPEEEARNWFLESLKLLMQEAEQKKLACEASGDERGEAQWGVRWAVVKQKIVEIRTKDSV